ncbi:hypothetical protein GCM10017784_11480 [Deinococcus indicus]|uniref:ImmA/IrrE family metallo-endopeptidase n=1 Tax=Deinococcus indicus TaxID=223556 RepID=UPI001749B7EF|nr:ImmA/IrrE family metallo-endopeptidase [Deinococcus indicus]GHG21644.1 hypothetical protein GCM10017784_11480 [Deinococcus indicus]
MRYATMQAIDFARSEHARVGYLTDPERLAHAWGVRIIPGKRSSAHAGPPSIITLQRDAYAPRQRFTTHHELAHILVQRSLQERAILAEVDEEDAHAHLEAVVNYIAAMLVMPDTLIEKAFDMFGVHPETILTIQHIAGVSLAAALRRFTYAHLDHPITTLLTSGPFLIDLASTDPYNPFTRYQRLPDIGVLVPRAQVLTLPCTHRRTLAVLSV